MEDLLTIGDSTSFWDSEPSDMIIIFLKQSAHRASEDVEADLAFRKSEKDQSLPALSTMALQIQLIRATTATLMKCILLLMVGMEFDTWEDVREQVQQ